MRERFATWDAARVKFYSAATANDLLADARFALDDAIEREPYPEVEAQNRRCYLFAHRKS
jgi:hypothetical protein